MNNAAGGSRTYTRGASRGALRAAAALAFAAILGGCAFLDPAPEGSTPAAQPAAQAAPQPAPGGRTPSAESAAAVAVAEFDRSDDNDTGELRFLPGDAVKVAIWGNPELDHVAVVQPNGNITLPLIGEVPAAEATVSQLRERVTEDLKPFTRFRSPELRPGDTLLFEVWHEDSLRHVAVIDPQGYATFPIIGAIQAAGRPVEAIRKEAHARMLQYVRDAQVSVLPTYANRRVLQDYVVSVLSQQLQPRRIAVIGEVGVQGLSELRNGTRVLDALAEHQVKQATAAMNSIVVIRNPSVGKPRYRVVRVDDFLAGQAPNENIVLRNGDIVIVPKTPIAKVGDFVELFFSRTMPVFTWWSGLWQAARARDSSDTVRLINEALRRELTNITVTPTP